MLHENFLEKRKRSAPCQLKDGGFHQGGGRVKRAQFKSLFISRFSGVNYTRVDQNQSTGRGSIFCAFMRERLTASFNEAEHKIIMAVPRISMLNIISVQEFNIEVRMMGNFCPFLGLHTLSVPEFYHRPEFGVLHDIALFQSWTT